ncbi:heme exporter protein B [Hydrogenophilus thermoluteolus]|uniref:heme exporter protein CcmB n=1 Tax=Hydrogenophilus thermoluteolus TaxID=297 RepID=UPI0024A4B9C6|nr:heme exporter protein CcmB [Hydrogenophilus thermoluteolus]GLW60983.1 heme exporter protein B [Hydrogenophilus thermoluteolus]
MIALFLAVLRREALLAWRSRADTLVALTFFVIVATLFPFGVGTDERLLRTIAPGILWVTALLAVLLTLPRLFEHDWRDGTLEQLLLSAEPAPVWLGAKLLAHWVTTAVPLAVLAPLLALLYDVEPVVYGWLPVTLLLGTPMLTLIGAVGAALTLGLRASGLLLALLVLPLFVPVLIFGVDAVTSARDGAPFAAQLALLAGGSLAAAALAPWGCAAALRLAVE